MRYTKAAVLAFGFGLFLGLAAVAGEFKSLERVASGLMAVGIAGIPVGMVADWRRAVRAAKKARQPSRKIAARRNSPAACRPRKAALPKR
jgi:hypothetical protein